MDFLYDGGIDMQTMVRVVYLNNMGVLSVTTIPILNSVLETCQQENSHPAFVACVNEVIAGKLGIPKTSVKNWYKSAKY